MCCEIFCNQPGKLGGKESARFLGKSCLYFRQNVGFYLCQNGFAATVIVADSVHCDRARSTMTTPNSKPKLGRRRVLQVAAMGMGGLLALGQTSAQTPDPPAGPAQPQQQPSEFQIACNTSAYSRFPLLRALQGIAQSGYKFVAWGTSHLESTGKRVPVLPVEADPSEAEKLAQRCRDLGLSPLLLHSNVAPEHPDAVASLTSRIKQAAAAGIPQVLTHARETKVKRSLWVQRFRELAKVASDQNVVLVLRQGNGETGSGRACAELIGEVDHSHVRINYDAAMVMGGLNIDPVPDLKTCHGAVESFTITDHRNVPKRENCGPGLGEIDHYKLLGLVSHTGKVLPLCCENVVAPLLPAPKTPEEVDELARRARQYLELVTAGLQSKQQAPS